MQPVLQNRQPRCQPARVGPPPGTEINDLKSGGRARTRAQIVDQLWKERTDRYGPGGVVGGNASGEPAGVDDGCCGRSR